MDGQWASIPHRRDASIACWASLDGTARVNGYTKNDKIPEWDEMGVELDDGTDGIPLMTRFEEGLSYDGTSTMSGGLQLASGLA